MEIFSLPPWPFFDRYVEIAEIDLTFTAIACLVLRFGGLERGFGGLFLELLQRWSNPSRFCTKPKKATPPPAEEEAPAKPVEGVAQGVEQTEAPTTPQEEEEGNKPPPHGPPRGQTGQLGRYVG